MTAAARSFVVEPRYCGPPNSGNGGYVSGRLAAFFDDPHACVEVTLRSPPPLGVRLDVKDAEDGGLLLYDADTLVAQARRTTLDAEPPGHVDYDEATDAAGRYDGRRDHPFPTCFVCGVDRATGDGLRLEPGSVGSSRVAAAWQPHESLARLSSEQLRAGAAVAPEFVWAALDCPGGWATNLSGRPMVLGRMTAELTALPQVGHRYVVVGQLRRTEGRKAFTASALYSADAELLARAEATWLAVDPGRYGESRSTTQSAAAPDTPASTSASGRR